MAEAMDSAPARPDAATALPPGRVRGGIAPGLRSGSRRRRPWLARARALPAPAVTALIAGVYFLCAKFSLKLAIVHASATAVWPTTGIALGGLLLLGYRVWPGIFAGAFLANATTAGSIATSFGIASGNTLEGLLGAFLVNRFANGLRAFDRVQDTFRFAILAGMVSTAVSATLGPVSLVLGGFARWADVGPIWITWWLGDMGGALVVAPLLILWNRHHRFRWTRERVLEAVFLALALLGVGQMVFGWLYPIGVSGHPLKFLCVPLLAWVAYRFDQRTAAMALLLLAAIAVRGTVSATPALDPGELNASLVLVQVFMAVVAVTTLALAAVVSERERVEAAVRATSEDLREAMAELEAFGHATSHDLRSPIGAVLNYTAIIREDYRGQFDEEGLRLLGRIRASAESAANLLDQLVSFSWAGHEGEERPSIDMTSLAEDAYAEVAAGAEEAGGVSFELHDLPPAQGNALLLGRVFRNLFSNAVKYTRGQVERRVVVTGRTGEVENTYCVTDNGIGFDPGQAGSLFEPFRRLSGSKEFEGSGLGLAIAAKIIRKHAGRIWAESDGSSGARFWFTLPRREGGG